MNHFKNIATLTVLFCMIASICFSKPIGNMNCMSFIDKQYRFALKEIEKKQIGDNSLTKKNFPRSLMPNGELMLVAPDDWTSGFFPGSLWYLYENTNELFWKQQAIKYTEILENQKFNTSNHDVGFMMYCSYGNGYRLTKTTHYKEVLIQSAKSLSTRFNPKVGLIRSWDFNKDKWQYPVIIDNMMNLELLFWAFRETKDSSFYKIAVSHANKTLENHFRIDGSCYHVVDYDTITGNARLKMTYQGFSDESSWARGQAWALYGYTVMYRETGDKKYLKQTEKIANFIFTNKNMPADLVPFWDFDAPRIPNVPKDASAASVTASALLDLATLDTSNMLKYNTLANKIIYSLEKDYQSKLGENRGFLLKQSTGFLPWGVEINVPLNYADYYFMEALTRQKNIEKK